MPVVVTEIGVRTAEVTVSLTDPVTPNMAALMLVVPGATPVATPLLPDELLIVAAAVLSEAQVACVVIVWVVPSLKVPTAVKPSFADGWSVAPDGATAIEVSVALDTVTVVESDTEPTFAVMVEVPGVSPESKPDWVMVATAVFEELQEVT